MNSESVLKDMSIFAIIPIIQGNLNLLAAECHAANQHWWHDPATGKRLDRNRGELFMLMVSEVSEAMEGERKNLMDDHLPHRRMAEVELADTVIRIMDYAGAKRFNLDSDVGKHYLPPLPENKGDALMQIVDDLSAACRAPFDHIACSHLARAILLIIRYASRHGYDLDGAVAEKRAYNLHRADHKAEARLAVNGKKW